MEVVYGVRSGPVLHSSAIGEATEEATLWSAAAGRRFFYTRFHADPGGREAGWRM